MSTAVAGDKRNAIIEYFRGFGVLRETRLEFWGLQFLNLMDMLAYFALADIVIVMLSANFRFSDIEAGYVWTGVGAIVSLTMFFTGAWTDALGVKRALMVALAGNVVGRLGLIAAGLLSEETLHPVTSALGFDALIRWLHSIGMQSDVSHRAILGTLSLFFLAPFFGMSSTVYQAGNRRFTTARSRGAGFNLWYLGMNAGSFFAGLIVDLVRVGLKLDNTHIVTFGAITTTIGLVALFFLIRSEAQCFGPDETPVPLQDVRSRGILSHIGEVITRGVFWRFVLLVALIVAVRAIFIYLHNLYPKYWLRVIGPEAWIGALQALNPALVVVGLVLLIPIVRRFSVYSMLAYGALISTLSLFVLAIPAYGNAVYVTSVVSLVLLSVGEVLWSPRLVEYTAAIAPRGQEGVYYGLAALPWFVAKTISSLLSGHMLNRYIPEFPDGELILRDRLAAGTIPFENSPSMLFIILGGVTILGPLIAIALRGFFTKGAHFEKAEAAH